MNKIKLLSISSVLLLLSFLQIYGQTTDLAPGENLYVDGVPSIPQTIVQEVGRYTEFRSAGILSWHPKKHEMLISTRFGDVPQVHSVKFPGGARTQMTFFPERVTGASYNPKNESYFIFSKDIGGGSGFKYSDSILLREILLCSQTANLVIS